MSYDLFISYSRADDEIVDRIEAHLRNAGLTCFRDKRDIEGAANFRERIAAAVRDCQAVVAVISDEAARSEYVSAELSSAQDFKKKIVPVLLTQKPLNSELKFVLGRFNWIFAGRDLERKLTAIETACWDGVEKGRNPHAFSAIEEVQCRANFHHAVNFPSNSLGFEMGDFGRGPRKVVGAGFQMTAAPGVYLGSVARSCPRLADFDIQMRFEKHDGPDNDWFGLEFGALWPEGYYQVLVNGQGTLRLAKHSSGNWITLHVRDKVPGLQFGNCEYRLRIVRLDSAFHIFVNGRHGLTCKDNEFPLGKVSIVVSPGMSVTFHELDVHGWAIDQSFEEALHDRDNLEISKAHESARRIEHRVPGYCHPNRDFSLKRLLTEPLPDKHSGVLLVLGHAMLPQIHEHTPAIKLREEIARRGRSQFETAFLVTDTGLLNDSKYQACPWISIGGPETNVFTRHHVQQIPKDTMGTSDTFIHHCFEQGERKVLLWGGGREQTVAAVEQFISSGLLNRFLDLIWKRGA